MSFLVLGLFFNLSPQCLENVRHTGCFKKYFLKMDGWMNGQLNGWPNILIKNEKTAK